jgi:AraC-like DNA-binding protein
MLVPTDFGEQNLRTRSFWGVTLVLEGRITLKEVEEPPAERGPGTLLWFHGDHFSQETLPFRVHPGLRECAFTMDAKTARKLEDVALLRFEKRVRQVPLTSGLVLDYLDIFQTFCEAALPTETILRRVMTFLDRLEPPPPRDFGPDWVRRTAELLRQHVEPGFSMREAARVVGVPYPVFRREFRTVMGQAPIQYQLQARMQRARHWLRTRSVKETAALLGYDDPFLFSRQFKRVTGVAPSEFRG